MKKRNVVFASILTLVLLSTACQSKKTGCPGSFHHKAAKNINTSNNV
jgi:hypothetical protein